jgi:hypothetical protein
MELQCETPLQNHSVNGTTGHSETRPRSNSSKASESFSDPEKNLNSDDRETQSKQPVKLPSKYDQSPNNEVETAKPMMMPNALAEQFSVVDLDEMIWHGPLR